MSKLEILQRAINYIRDLSHSLESGEITSPRKLASIPIPKRTRSRKSRLNKELFPKSEDSEDYASKNSHSPNAGTPTEQLWYEPPPAMAHTPYNPACYYSSGATLPSCHASFNQNIFSPTESHSDSSIYSFNSSSSAPNDDDFVIDDNLLAELTSIISSQQTTVADPPFPFSFWPSVPLLIPLSFHTYHFTRFTCFICLYRTQRHILE